jgi:hypothetical protein
VYAHLAMLALAQPAAQRRAQTGQTPSALEVSQKNGANACGLPWKDHKLMAARERFSDFDIKINPFLHQFFQACFTLASSDWPCQDASKFGGFGRCALWR